MAPFCGKTRPPLPSAQRRPRGSAYKRFASQNLGPGGIHSCRAFEIVLGPRGKRRFPAGAADEDVKNILNTLERELGAVLR